MRGSVTCATMDSPITGTKRSRHAVASTVQPKRRWEGAILSGNATASCPQLPAFVLVAISITGLPVMPGTLPIHGEGFVKGAGTG